MRERPTWPSKEPGPRYRGPVEWVEPTYHTGYAKMFCPKCGSTDLEEKPESFWRRNSSYPPGRYYICNNCDYAFITTELPDSELRDRRYTIYRHQSPEYEDVDDPIAAAWEALQDSRDSTDTYRNLARDYYGKAYSDLESDDWIDDPASQDTAYRMEMDIPAVELNHVAQEGYIDGMFVGNEVWIPGTPITIVRTKNSRAKKGKRWLR